MNQKTVSFQSKEGFNLVGVLTTPDGSGPFPVVIMVHGHASSKNSDSYVTLEKLLLPLGVATFRFDYRSHGDSKGDYPKMTESGIISDIRQAIDYLFTKHGDLVDKNKVMLYGSSLSGLPVIVVASDDNRVTHLLVRSGVNDFKAYFEKAYDVEKWKSDGYVTPRGNNPRYKRLNYSFYEDGLKYKLEEIAPKISVPTFIIHGDADETVDLFHSQELLDLLEVKDKTLEVIAEADHWYKGHREEMQRVIIEWVKKHL